MPFSVSASPDVLIWVQGRVNGTKVRSVIRESFGNQKFWPDNIKVQVLFITGRLQQVDAESQHRLEYEFEQYRDIIQADFVGKSMHVNAVSKVCVCLW